jgi:hypothetical protein
VLAYTVIVFGRFADFVFFLIYLNFSNLGITGCYNITDMQTGITKYIDGLGVENLLLDLRFHKDAPSFCTQAKCT